MYVYDTVSSRAFFVFGPSKWNDLPHPLRQKPALGSFKSNLKTFSFPKIVDLPCFLFRAMSLSIASLPGVCCPF